MKLFIVLMMLTGLALANEAKKEVPKELGDKARALIEDKAEEDCEEKAKKPVVIPEEPVLGGLGNAGCSIDDM